MIYDNSHFAAAHDEDYVGREYIRIRQALRFLTEQASLGELQSIVRMLIRSGSWSQDDIATELTDLVGDHMDSRIARALSEGMDILWEDDGERLMLIGE